MRDNNGFTVVELVVLVAAATGIMAMAFAFGAIVHFILKFW